MKFCTRATGIAAVTSVRQCLCPFWVSVIVLLLSALYHRPRTTLNLSLPLLPHSFISSRRHLCILFSHVSSSAERPSMRGWGTYTRHLNLIYWIYHEIDAKQSIDPNKVWIKFIFYSTTMNATRPDPSRVRGGGDLCACVQFVDELISILKNQFITKMRSEYSIECCIRYASESGRVWHLEWTLT